MNKLIIIPLISTILFCLVKFFEKKTFNDENIVLKIVVRDAIVVFCVTLIGNLIEFYLSHHLDLLLNIITDTKIPIGGLTEIFTDNPNF